IRLPLEADPARLEAIVHLSPHVKGSELMLLTNWKIPSPPIMLQNRRFLLIRRPSGLPVAEDFELVTEVVPPLSEGQFLVSNQYASLDPAIRGWMDDAPSYLPPIKLGDPVRAPTIGTVIQSRHADFPVGKWISGMNAIEDYSVYTSSAFTSLIA